jgi:hypothetical protein
VAKLRKKIEGTNFEIGEEFDSADMSEAEQLWLFGFIVPPFDGKPTGLVVTNIDTANKVITIGTGVDNAQNK